MSKAMELLESLKENESIRNTKGAQVITLDNQEEMVFSCITTLPDGTEHEDRLFIEEAEVIVKHHDVRNWTKGEIKMRTWERNGYKVVEQEFDYSLHQFAVIVPGKKDQVITPDSIESMDSIIADLDNGEEVEGWEDGMGNTIYTNPDLLEDED